MNDDIPIAEVVTLTSTQAVVKCPYCGRHHAHTLQPNTRPGREHRAPGCGLERTPAQRATGYQFTTTTTPRE